jgi:hypothetical protein
MTATPSPAPQRAKHLTALPPSGSPIRVSRLAKLLLELRASPPVRLAHDEQQSHPVSAIVERSL